VLAFAQPRQAVGRASAEWLAGEGIRSVERLSQVDRKTVRRYVAAAVAAGVDRGVVSIS